MAQKGVKIKGLATELGVTSRQIIDRCRSEGIRVQNSITRLSRGEAELVRSWFSSLMQQGDRVTEDPEEADRLADSSAGEDANQDEQASLASSRSQDDQGRSKVGSRPIPIRSEPASETIIPEGR